MLLAERFVGEILGWDLVDWPAVAQHKGRKFSFQQQRWRGPSIHDRLTPFFERCDPERDDFSPLKPSPIVNDGLTRLVGLVCGHIGKHHLNTGDADGGPALQRTIEQDLLHLGVVEHFLDRIDDSPILAERAGRLKRIATTAENELEKHFAELINERLEAGFLSGGALDRQKRDSLLAQAKGRMAESQSLNHLELEGLAIPHLELEEDALLRIEMAKILLNRFPYLDNYELMMQAELAMLQQPLAPRFLRERDLAGEALGIDGEKLLRWDEALQRLSPSSPWRDTLASQVFAVCGSGPLPLSALFLHLFTGASMVLIDADASAIERSRRLIGNLERLEILSPGAMTFRQGDASSLPFQKPERIASNTSGPAIACDAVLIASLVDRETKARIAARLQQDPGAPDLLVMRSATGLGAKLAYDPIEATNVNRHKLAYCGETMPATHVTTHLDRLEAINRGVACRQSPDVLAIAHPDVVNTTEVYRVIPALGRGKNTSFDERIRLLEEIARGATRARSEG